VTFAPIVSGHAGITGIETRITERLRAETLATYEAPVAHQSLPTPP
jgi:hypothetical protein